MSKIKKALKKPRVFFADMLVKHSEHHLMPGKVLDHKVVSQFIEKYRTKDKIFISSTNPNERFNLNFLEEYKVVLCSGEGLSAGMAHIELWLPSFIHANINFIVLVRHAVLYDVLLHKYPDLSIVFCKRPIDVENFFSRNTSIRTVFYPSSTGNNIHLVGFEKLKHIFIGHGDSDKASSANKALRLY